MLRLSKNFLLLDFLYDQSTMDCVVHCGEQLSRKVASELVEGSDVVLEGKHLCKTILDRIVEKHGPISISAGLWFQDLPNQGRAHDSENPVHRWSRGFGAATDVVVHSWVNQDKRPASFEKTLLADNIEYHRFLKYSGSEFICLASRSQGNKFECGTDEWKMKNERIHRRMSRGGAREDWRREPYTHSHGAKSWSNMGYEERLMHAESLWCNESGIGSTSNITASVVFGRKPPKGKCLLDYSMVEVEGADDDGDDCGRRVVRPWHVRVSENFVLLDFCRNEKMFERREVTVPPLTLRTANTVIKVARMFGEVLDPVKEHLGNISVVRGMEPKGFASRGDTRVQYHRWIPALCDTHSIEFVTPTDPKSGYLDLLERDKRKGSVVEYNVRCDSEFGGDRVSVTIRNFTPNCHFTSASGEEFPWTE